MRTVRSASIKNIPEAAAPSISQTYAQRSRTAEKSIARKRFADVGNLAEAKEHSVRGAIYQNNGRLVRNPIRSLDTRRLSALIRRSG